MRLGATNRYAWAPRGDKAYGHDNQHSWQNITMIGAMSTTGLRGFMTVDAPTSGEIFLAFVCQELVRHLRPGDCVVMDNLGAHKNKQACEAIEATGATVKFLPPYSPDFNPIEKLWSKIKEIVRRFDTMTRDLFDRAVAIALRQVSTNDLQAWTQHCGYSIYEA